MQSTKTNLRLMEMSVWSQTNQRNTEPNMLRFHTMVTTINTGMASTEEDIIFVPNFMVQAVLRCLKFPLLDALTRTPPRKQLLKEKKIMLTITSQICNKHLHLFHLGYQCKNIICTYSHICKNHCYWCSGEGGLDSCLHG